MVSEFIDHLGLLVGFPESIGDVRLSNASFPHWELL